MRMRTPLLLRRAPARPRAWAALQLLTFVAGAGILLALVLAPALGLTLLWNVLIPAAPLLFLLVPGVWRNLCPLATAALLPHRLGWSHGLRMPRRAPAWTALGGVALLMLLVPARRILFDHHAGAAVWLLLGAGALAVGAGLLFEAKSGWCAGLCPVRPVEELYGERPLATFANAHCGACSYCSTPCPDSTPAPQPGHGGSTLADRLAHHLMVGAFPGFVWAWFHVPDALDGASAAHALRAYGLPTAAGALTWAIYALARAWTPDARRPRLVRGCALASVACYYWYRLPALLGFGIVPGDGVLVDARGRLPEWTPWLLHAVVLAAALALFLVMKENRARAWQRRPAPDRKSRKALRV
jgi:hypothetical protein